MNKSSHRIKLLFLLFFSYNLQAQLIIEAEDAMLTGTTIGTSHTDYSGTGYVTDFTQIGDKLTLAIDIPEDGNYIIEIKYSSPFGDKTNDIYLDDKLISSQIFVQNSNWTSVILDGTQPMTAGKHSIEVRHNWGYFEVDYFSFKKIVGQAPVIVVKNISSIDTENDGKEDVLIDATHSRDSDGSIVSYNWEFEGNSIGDSAKLLYTFPFGESEVIFTITDNDDNSESKKVKIIIADLTNNGHHRLPIRDGKAFKFMSG
ncbi:MAG: hypothetical protein ACI9VN_002586, partial [Patescibacteria group bacterium]